MGEINAINVIAITLTLEHLSKSLLLKTKKHEIKPPQ